MGKYAKFVVSLIGTVIVGLEVFGGFGQDHVAVVLLTALASSFGVLLVPNKPS